MDCKNTEIDANQEKAMLYYSQNGIPKLLEELLNDMFYDNPDDIFTYLGNSFHELAKPPSFSKIVARLILTAQNDEGLKMLVFYLVNSQEKLITQVHFSFNAISAICDVQEQIIINWINESVTMAFQGTNFKQLTESDDAITQIVNSSLPLQFLLQSTTTSTDNEAKKSEIRKSKFGDTNTTDPLEEETKKSAQMLVKSILTWGLSSAMFSAAAALNQRPLHLHLRRLYEDSGDKNPEFLVTIFHNAKAAPSKLILCSEVGVIVPTTQGFKAMVKCVQLLYKATEKVMRLKTGMSSLLTSEEGAILLTNFEKLDQVLEVVHEICSSSDVLSRGNMRYFLSCDPNETFDSERGRYEISKGVFKSCDDVVDMYVDLMKKIPLLGVLIDPLHPEDGNSWIRLSLRQEEETSCSVLTSLNVPNIVDYIETQSQSLIVPGIVVQPQIVGSISDFIKFQSLLEKLNINAIMDISALDVIDAHLIDMVIGCSASMIKIGGTVGGERAAILNRILEIDLEMESCVRDDVSDDVTSNDGSALASTKPSILL